MQPETLYISIIYERIIFKNNNRNMFVMNLITDLVFLIETLLIHVIPNNNRTMLSSLLRIYSDSNSAVVTKSIHIIYS